MLKLPTHSGFHELFHDYENQAMKMNTCCAPMGKSSHSKGGDVDMFGHEGGQTLTERKQKLDRNLALITEVKERLQNSTDEFNRIDRDIWKRALYLF